MTGVALLRIDRYAEGDCVVLAPVGVLDVRSYGRLREALVKASAEQPAALVVDLRRLQVADVTLLSVFPAVSTMSPTPSLPLLLAAAGRTLQRMLDTGAVPHFVPTYPSVSAALASAAERPPRQRRQLDLPCSSAAARSARLWIRELCAEWDLPDTAVVDAAVQVGSELVENMVLHARTPGRLRMELHGAGLTVAVADGSSRPPYLRPAGERAQVSGLGVVDELATAWGHRLQIPDGKVVWVVLPLPPLGTGPPVPRRVPTLPLRTGLALTGLGMQELFSRYAEQGGRLSAAELVDALTRPDLGRPEYDAVALALNDHFTERGESYEVPHAGDAELSDPE